MGPISIASRPAVRSGLVAACLPCDSEWIAAADNDTCFLCGNAGVPGRVSDYCGHGVRGGYRCQECAV